ncbi:MAG: urea ABC transporter ATP-binding protein UrtD [SAR202 cluster bacterium]|nr:urea ABC transporter ATP-binding protein UrtD [SAR202 cluster bacterium]
MGAEALLQLDHVTVSFNGFKALNELSYTIVGGGLKVLIGPNGSGKSTLLDAVIGRVRPVEGRVVYQGRDITAMPEHKIAQLGIRRKFQAPGVLNGLTVEENVAVAVRQSKGIWRNLRTGLPNKEKAKVEEVLRLVELTDKRLIRASHLGHGEKQWLEMGMVMGCEPDLLLLDEPTSGMTPSETTFTAKLVRQLAETTTVLVIDHDMSFVEELGAPVSVLHQGRLLREGAMETIRNDPEVVSVYLGRAVTKTDAHA